MKKRIEPDPTLNSSSWILTFSDMVTLLLTFFVMIICITSLDPRTLADTNDDDLTEIAPMAPQQGPGVLGFSNPLLMAPIISMIEQLEQLPPNISLDQDEILAALFQLDPINTPNYQRLQREITDSVSIFKDERGMVIRWDKAILFAEGSIMLREENVELLNRVADLLATLTLPVSVEGFTNPMSELEGGESIYAYTLSSSRAKLVMQHLVGRGIPERRFRLGSYGGSRPVTADPAKSMENSRLEIVIYKPAKSSWTG
ncbi:MAG: OmpA family protein [Deltaproteobacteria bacterium]|jgi:chemotaxis protein MotB|nr:OmpA family protein [Deltaproteobacteria bacterium]